MAADAGEPVYGIGAVAKLTGLTDHTIRVWERRYAAIVARRAANGRRVYTAADVEKLRLLKLLTDRGLAIGGIAGSGLEELRAEIESIGDITTAPVPGRVRAAVFGDTLPRTLPPDAERLAPVEVQVADSDDERFKADLATHEVDVVVLQCAVLDADATDRLGDYMQRGGATRGVIVYGFGRTRDVARARASGCVVLRAPVDADDLVAAVIRSFGRGTAARAPSPPRPAAAATDTAWEFDGAPAPRRFTPAQLARLAGVSNTIDCECPQHLAQLVGDLTSFEIYSAQCANRDDDDAALHRYLQQTTAKARSLIEVALERVARAEGLEF